ncbi:hypothetical protein EDB89DRAFT_1980369 [Lactarius sanguifluus]|nr:hypothetical protein EDB89DRAFT_1980369 [Lactarius sanguifluus]
MNLNVSIDDIPLTDITVTIPRPLNVQYYVPITTPNTSSVGAGGGPVFRRHQLCRRLHARTRRSHRVRKDGAVVQPPHCRILV